jgi:hypothetical protein
MDLSFLFLLRIFMVDAMCELLVSVTSIHSLRDEDTLKIHTCEQKLNTMSGLNTIVKARCCRGGGQHVIIAAALLAFIAFAEAAVPWIVALANAMGVE